MRSETHVPSVQTHERGAMPMHSSTFIFMETRGGGRGKYGYTAVSDQGRGDIGATLFTRHIHLRTLKGD